ncbi:MAG: hypothetical protein JSS62_02725 [Verrucomicrobia bacterium]|nr:hypothetical protein [Verrucomicrobiota bacterium]MBS0646442.1 hypothetical protein [Verrucomicrobiota bacterium]
MTVGRVSSKQSFFETSDEPSESHALSRSDSKPIAMEGSPHSPKVQAVALTADEIDSLFRETDKASSSIADKKIMLRRVDDGGKRVEENQKVQEIFRTQHPASLSSSYEEEKSTLVVLAKQHSITLSSSFEDRMKGCNVLADEKSPEVEASPYHRGGVSGASTPESDLSSHDTVSDVDDNVTYFGDMMSPEAAGEHDV